VTLTEAPPRRTSRRGDDRVPPHNLDAEASVLGAMLLNFDAARAARASGLVADDFWKPAHQHIYHSLEAFLALDMRFDAVLVADELRADGLLDSCGGTEYLLQLQDATPAISHVARYAKIVRETSMARRLIATAAEITELAYSEPDDMAEAIAEADVKLIALAESAGPRENRFEKLVLIGDQITTIARPEPLIEGLLMRREISVVFGKPGAAKSFLALDWSASIASGSWWMGHRVHKGRVLYVIAEGAAGMGDRFDSWRVARNVRDLSDLHWLPVTVNLYNPGDVSELIKYASGRGYEMIVIDTLARCSVGAEENNGKDVGIIIYALERLRLASGAAILLVHHTPKDGETMRGHTALEGAVDTTIKVGQSEGIIRVENHKQKNSAKFDTITLSLVDYERSAVLVPGTTRIDPDGDRSISRMVSMMNVLADLDDGNGVAKGTWLLAVKEDLNIEKTTFGKVLKLLKDRDYVEQTSDNQRASWRLTDLGKEAIRPPDEVTAATWDLGEGPE
jgi:predicted transcriptional regulator